VVGEWIEAGKGDEDRDADQNQGVEGSSAFIVANPGT